MAAFVALVAESAQVAKTAFNNGFGLQA